MKTNEVDRNIMYIAFLNPQGNFDSKDSYWTQHQDFGGQLVYVKEVAIAMAQLGMRVDIITRQFNDELFPEFAPPFDAYPNVNNVRIVRLPCGPNKFLPKEELWPYLGTEWVPNILDFFENQGVYPHAVTTHYADGGISGALIYQRTRIPFTFTAHSLGAQKLEKLLQTNKSLEELDAQYHFARRITAERLTMQYTSKIITSTRQERFHQYSHPAYHGAVDPSDDNKFSIIPPGVNLRIFSKKHSPLDKTVSSRIAQALHRDISPERQHLPVILASSRLERKKNHLGLVKAFAANDKLQQKCNLAIAVRNLSDPLHDFSSLSPPEQGVLQEIMDIINTHNLWGKITGFALNSQEELASAYRVLATRKSVFALTALYEPFGLAPLEAMSCGLPVVVTKNGGPSESLVEDGQEYGVLVDPQDPDDIAKGLLRLLDNPSEWTRFSESGIKRVAMRYSWEQTASDYIDIIEAMLKDHQAPSPINIPAYFISPSEETDISVEFLRRIYHS